MAPFFLYALKADLYPLNIEEKNLDVGSQYVTLRREWEVGVNSREGTGHLSIIFLRLSSSHTVMCSVGTEVSYSDSHDF